MFVRGLLTTTVFISLLFGAPSRAANLIQKAVLGAAVVTNACNPLPNIIPPAPASHQAFEEWGNKRVEASQIRIEDKFAPTDKKIAGVTLAAPADPKGEYQFVWGRDNSIIEKEVQHRRDIIEARMQFYRRAIKEGSPGEPRFNPDGSLFKGPWGRPQIDTSAYRSFRWMDEIDYQLAHGKTPAELKEHYNSALENNPSVKWDLEYLAHNWRINSFELWEEEEGIHTHPLQLIHSALDRGAKMAKLFEPEGENSAAYLEYFSESQKIKHFLLENAWNKEDGYIHCTLKHTGGFVTKKEPLDISVIMGAMDSLEGNPGGSVVYELTDDKLMATMAQLEKRNSEIYRVNGRFQDPKYRGAVALGRYPEDVFHGGNPWAIATHTGGKYYYLLAKKLRAGGPFQITATNFKFYERLMGNEIPELPIGTVIPPGSPLGEKVLLAMREKGDAYAEIMREFAPTTENPAEQIGRGYQPGDQGPWVSKYLEQHHAEFADDKTLDRHSTALPGGEPQGALDLTWNDASFISMWRARKELLALEAKVRAAIH